MSKHLPMSIRVAIEETNPSICRDPSLCIMCGLCRNVCTMDIGVHDHYDLNRTGDKAICINCGQCANACPTKSIKEVEEIEAVKKAILDPNKIVIFSTSPSVRVALGEEFSGELGGFVQGKMVSLLKKLGGDYVLDTNFSADLTIMEEASELVDRILKKNKPLPQFTSCCPAWVKFVETYYPEFRDNLSSAKSPIGMQGPIIKTYFANKMGIDPNKIINVAVTPCTAKKFEIRRDEMNASSKFLDIPNLRDMDYVITTRELAKWAKQVNIDFMSLEDSCFDNLLGEASGAGVIFGNTGGVMEAAVRTAHYLVTGKNLENGAISLHSVRGFEGIREASVDINGITLNLAIVYGTANARKLIEMIKSNEKSYDFIEVMTCPGGCIGGGGQPIHMDQDNARKSRMSSLYSRDENISLRFSHENCEIAKLYEEFLGKPLSARAHELLHTSYNDRSRDLDINK